MNTGDDLYRDLAQECMEVADRTRDPGRRVSLLELAGRWFRLADKVHDRKKALAGDALLDPPGVDRLPAESPEIMVRNLPVPSPVGVRTGCGVLPCGVGVPDPSATGD
jgi:hypothetical protein